MSPVTQARNVFGLFYRFRFAAPVAIVMPPAPQACKPVNLVKPVTPVTGVSVFQVLHRFKQILCNDDPLYFARAFADGAEL